MEDSPRRSLRANQLTVMMTDLIGVPLMQVEGAVPRGFSRAWDSAMLAEVQTSEVSLNNPETRRAYSTSCPWRFPLRHTENSWEGDIPA